MVFQRGPIAGFGREPVQKSRVYAAEWTWCDQVKEGTVRPALLPYALPNYRLVIEAHAVRSQRFRNAPRLNHVTRAWRQRSAPSDLAHFNRWWRRSA